MSTAATALKIQDEKLSSLGLQKTIVNAEQVATYTRKLGAASTKNPVIVLLHGYPQSAYSWRHLIPLLPPNSPLFVPDLPGYGASAPIKDNDKLSVGNATIAALVTQVKRSFSGTSAPEQIPVILIGHDRGARVVHRIAVSGYPGVDIRGVVFVDIIPTIVQWQGASGSPSNVVGWFHWPFLANIAQSIPILSAYGGGKWATDMILRWAGSNPAGLESLKSDNALDVYAGFMDIPHVLEASSKDYEAGATVDLELQEEDQKAGRKVQSSVLVLWSEGYHTFKKRDFLSPWKDWVGEGVKLEGRSLGNGYGHFCTEEAPKESAELINGWLRGLGVEV